MMQSKIKLRPRQSESGFTLIELMVTVIVLAILTTVGIPAFRTMIVGQRIKSAAFDMMAALSLTRSEAIKRNSSVDITPVSGSWANGWTVTASGTTLNQHDAISNGVTITCYSGTSTVASCPKITYSGNGRLSLTSTPSIELSSTETTSIATRCIGIDLSGLPYSKKTSCP